MNIIDIAIAKQLAGGGGGSGTDSYNDLSNLPKINDVTLSGNKSSSALGLQSEITSDSKLASDLVDDTNQDNKFVTSAEKTTWNAKQNAIDADHKLSSSLVSFSEAEAAAIASGIDSSKVGQISTNQTNILSVQNATKELVDNGAKNCFPPANTITTTPGYGTTFSTTNNSITLLTSGNYTYANRALAFPIKAGSYNFSFTVSNLTGSNATSISLRANGTSQSGEIVAKSFTGNGNVNVDFTASADMTLYVLFYVSGSTYTDTTSYTASNLMITSQSEYGISSDYEPYALGNQMLTPALIECVDEGAKNKFNFDAWKSVGVYRGSKTVSGNSVTITSSQNDAFTYVDIANGYPQDALISVSTGDRLIFTWDYTNSNSQATDEVMICGNGAYTSYAHVLASAKYLEYTIPSGITYITIRLGVATSGDSATYSNIMICSASEYNISAKYEPYGLGNQYLTPAIVEQVNNGSKNKLASVIESDSTSDYTITRNADNTYTIVISNTVTGNHYYNFEYNIGSKYVGYVLSAGGSEKVGVVISRTAGSSAITTMNNNVGIIPADATNRIFISILDGAPAQTITLKPMICSVADWNVSHDYQPYALPNYDLTVREAEDRAALAEVVDEGAKNILPDLRNLGGSVYNATVSMDEKSVSVAASGDFGYCTLVYQNLKVGNYVCSCNIKSRTGSSITKIAVRSNSIMGVDLGANEFITNGKIYFSFNVTEQTDLYILFYGAFGAFINETSYIADDVMICTEADWKVSQKYAPYRKNLDQLEATKAPALSTITMDSGSLDDITTNSFIACSWEVAGKPISTMGFVRTSVFDANSALQEFYSFSADETQSGLVYVRDKQAGVWRSWKLLTNNT